MELRLELGRLALAPVKPELDVLLRLVDAVHARLDAQNLAPDVREALFVPLAELLVLAGAGDQGANLLLEALSLGADGAEVQLKRHLGEGVSLGEQPVAGASTGLLQV